MTSIAGDVLRRAAADVERHGVFRMPDEFSTETCPVVAINRVAWDFLIDRPGYDEIDDIENGVDALQEQGEAAIKATIGLTGSIPDWNDGQSSRAVVAAEMRAAADLADLLYGGGAA